MNDWKIEFLEGPLDGLKLNAHDWPHGMEFPGSFIVDHSTGAMYSYSCNLSETHSIYRYIYENPAENPTENHDQQ